VLDERTRYNLWIGWSNYCAHNPMVGRLGLNWYASSGRQERSKRLFDAAAEVRKMLDDRETEESSRPERSAF
jgi:hypothetical protein